MIFVTVLFLLALGIAASQALSKSDAVTLRWLRLGDLIALPLLAVGAAATFAGPVADDVAEAPAGLALPPTLLAVGVASHLVLVSLGHRRAQRAAAGLSVAAAVVALALLTSSIADVAAPASDPAVDATAGTDLAAALARAPADRAGTLVTAGWTTPFRGLSWPAALALAGVVSGGFLMTMLLGHAYLTAGGEMSHHPFLRLTRLMLYALLARGVLAAATGLAPWWFAAGSGEAFGDEAAAGLWTALEIVVRFAVGIAVPAVLTAMAIACVRIRSYQSATGILYVASLLVFIGELTALTLMQETGWAF